MILLARDGSIARNLTTVEWLKAELVGDTAELFRGILRAKEDLMLDSLSSIVLSCFLLARRLGFSFKQLELRVQDRVRLHLEAGHDVERWYGDLSACLQHLQGSRKERDHAQPPGATGSSL